MDSLTLNINYMDIFKPDSDQIAAMELFYSGKSVFLSGKAGVGKSTLIRHAINANKFLRRPVLLGTTGIAAINIGGQTLHSFFSIPPSQEPLTFERCNYVKTEKRMMWDRTSIIIIDEVSMLRPDVLDAIHWTLQKNHCQGLHRKQVIFVGDEKQLPPVIKQAEEEAFFNEYASTSFTEAKIYPRLNVSTVNLTHIHRQDNADFIEQLNVVREASRTVQGFPEYFDKFVTDEPKGVIITPHVETARHYNARMLSSLNTPLFKFKAEVTGEISTKDFNMEETLLLKDGAIVMHTVNDPETGLVNGSVGTIRIRTKEGSMVTPELVFEDDRTGGSYPMFFHVFEKKEYYYDEYTSTLKQRTVGSATQYPLKLAYAMTIHKSQGLTFEECTIDLSRSCFADGQLYTALSRVRGPEGLNIIL